MANLSADGAQIFVVPYCHADWAWTHTRHWHAERYRLVFEETLALLRRQEADGVPNNAPHAYRWYFDTFVTMLKPFLERRPDLLPELQRRVHEGRIAICGTYVNMRPNCVEGEAFVRSLVLGRRQFQALFPHADLSVQADFADVAWGHAQLPQLLSLAGYRYLRGWRPHAALNAKGVPHHFIWQGVDGTEVLCSRGSYGGLVHRNFCPPDYRDRWGEVLEHWTEWHLREHEERSPVPLLWIAHGADDNRPLRTHFTSDAPDAPMDLVGFIQEWNRREDSSRMGFATPVDVFAALEARRSALPTIAGTLDPCDVAYNAAFGGSEGLWRRRREAFRALLLAESLTVISTKAGAAPSTAYSGAGFDALWRAALTCSGHAQQWLFQDDFAELMRLAQATTWQARDLASRAAEALAAQVDLPERTVAVVENPLAFERSVLVPLLVTFVEADQGGVPAALRLEDGRGLEVEYQIQNEMRHEGVLWELAVLARLALPAGGWNTVSWKVDDTAAEEVNASTARRGTSTKRGARQLPEARPARLVLENELLRIELDQGRLVRVEDKETGLVDVAHAGLAYGHLCAYSVDATAPLHAGSIAGQQDAEWLDWRRLETGPVRQAALVLGRVGAHAVRVEIRLPARERRIEFAMRVDWRGQDGFLAFHLPLPAAGELWGGIPYGAERKELANEPYVGFERSRPGMFWAQDFVDWTDGGRGVACLPHDGDVYYVFDDARNSLGHILINSFTRPADTWEKDVNREIEARGTHTFVTSLVWHPGDWRTAQLWSLSRSLTVSPVVVRRRHGQGSLPPYHSLLTIEPANVCLAALYQEGDATLARLYETAGQATTASLTFPAPVREATVVDLLNEPLSGAERDVGQAAPIAGTGGTDRRRLTCQLRPWQIRTIALRT